MFHIEDILFMTAGKWKLSGGGCLLILRYMGGRIYISYPGKRSNVISKRRGKSVPRMTNNCWFITNMLFNTKFELICWACARPVTCRYKCVSFLTRRASPVAPWLVNKCLKVLKDGVCLRPRGRSENFIIFNLFLISHRFDFLHKYSVIEVD